MRVKSVLGFPLAAILVFRGVIAAPAAAAVLANETATPASSFVALADTKGTPVARDLVVLETIYVTCKHKKCPKRHKLTYDPDKEPKQIPRVTCAREALTALAKWREMCALDTFFHQYCWNGEPTLRSCCGKRIKYDDERYLDYPTARARRQINTPGGNLDRTYLYRLEYPEIKDAMNETRVILLHQPGNFNEEKDGCHYFRSQSLKEFHFWMRYLNFYGIEDADENGKVFGMEKWNPEGQWVNTQVFLGGEALVKYEEAIVKSGWTSSG